MSRWDPFDWLIFVAGMCLLGSCLGPCHASGCGVHVDIGAGVKADGGAQ